MQVSCSDRPKIYGSDEELCWVELLGEGILRVEGGAGESASTPVHQRAGQKEDRQLDQLKMFD